MRKFIFIIPIILILFGCGANNPSALQQFDSMMEPGAFITDPNTHKQPNTYLQNTVEGTPIVFNGQLYSIITGNLQPPDTQNCIGIYNIITKQHIITIPIGYKKYGSSLVHNNMIYIFFTEVGGVNNSVFYITSTDLLNWSMPQKMFSNINHHIYNTSVIHNGQEFIMAYEIEMPYAQATKFASSPDLINWSNLGNNYSGIFKNQAANPTIRYDSQFNKYYIIYASGYQNRFYTFICRTQDFITFEESPLVAGKKIVPLAPEAGYIEGSNNSDMDLCEYNGNTYILYAVGDQTAWLNMKIAVYNGSMMQYLRSFFAAP